MTNFIDLSTVSDLIFGDGDQWQFPTKSMVTTGDQQLLNIR